MYTQHENKFCSSSARKCYFGCLHTQTVVEEVEDRSKNTCLISVNHCNFLLCLCIIFVTRIKHNEAQELWMYVHVELLLLMSAQYVEISELHANLILTITMLTCWHLTDVTHCTVMSKYGNT